VSFGQFNGSAFYTSGFIYVNGVLTKSLGDGGCFTIGDVVSFYLDMDEKIITFLKNSKVIGGPYFIGYHIVEAYPLVLLCDKVVMTIVDSISVSNLVHEQSSEKKE